MGWRRRWANDAHSVVFDFTICRQTGGCQARLCAAAEACEGVSGGGAARDAHRQVVDPGCEQLVGKDLFAGIVPIAITVPIHPRTEQAGGVGGDVDGGVLTGHEVGRQSDAVFIVAGDSTSAEGHRTGAEIVTVGGDRGLAVGFGVDAGAEVDVGTEDVARAIARQ